MSKDYVVEGGEWYSAGGDGVQEICLAITVAKWDERLAVEGGVLFPDPVLRTEPGSFREMHQLPGARLVKGKGPDGEDCLFIPDGLVNEVKMAPWMTHQVEIPKYSKGQPAPAVLKRLENTETWNTW